VQVAEGRDEKTHNTGLGLGADLGSAFANVKPDVDDGEDLFGAPVVGDPDNTLFDKDEILKDLRAKEEVEKSKGVRSTKVGKGALELGSDDTKIDDLFAAKILTVGDDDTDKMFEKSKVKMLSQGGDTANAVEESGATTLSGIPDDSAVSGLEDGLEDTLREMKLADSRKNATADDAIAAALKDDGKKKSFLDSLEDDGGDPDMPEESVFDFASYISSEGGGGGGGEGGGGLFG
jgi:hypothetical protein